MRIRLQTDFCNDDTSNRYNCLKCYEYFNFKINKKNNNINCIIYKLALQGLYFEKIKGSLWMTEMCREELEEIFGKDISKKIILKSIENRLKE